LVGIGFMKLPKVVGAVQPLLSPVVKPPAPSGYCEQSLKKSSSPVCICLTSAMRLASLDLARAELSETKTTEAKIPMIEMTTKSSINVNPECFPSL